MTEKLICPCKDCILFASCNAKVKEHRSTGILLKCELFSDFFNKHLNGPPESIDVGNSIGELFANEYK